jgi:hypothetical protein
MLDPTSSFVRLARPPRLIWITCIAFAAVCWPLAALADDPNQAVTTGVPIVDAILKVLGAVYAILSAVLLILPKTSKLAQGLATFAVDSKGAAAVKEATTGKMAARLKRESTSPPPRGFAAVSVLAGLCWVAIAFVVVAYGLFLTSCKTNPARTACDIVHIIDDGCQTFVEVPLPDGTKEKVPRSAIVRLASDTKAARLAAPASSGAP